MKKIIAIIALITLVVSLTGCSGETYSMTPADSQLEVVKADIGSTNFQEKIIKENTQSEFEILSSNLISDHGLRVTTLLDTNENILYGFIAMSDVGEIFMLVDPSGSPYVYDGDPTHVPNLVFHERKYLTISNKSGLITYTFSDSIYNIRYALVRTAGFDNPGRVVTLLDANGKPSIY